MKNRGSERAPLFSAAAFLSSFGAVPFGFAIANLSGFQGDFAWLGNIALFIRFVRFLWIVGTILALIGLLRREQPRWLAYSSLGLTVGLGSILFMLWFSIRS